MVELIGLGMSKTFLLELGFAGGSPSRHPSSSSESKYY